MLAETMFSRASGRPAALSSDPWERGYPGGTAGDNPEGEDGRNLEMRIPSETKDGPRRQSASEEEDAEGEERRRCAPRGRKGEERQDEGQGSPETLSNRHVRSCIRKGYKTLVGREQGAGGGEEKRGGRKTS
ncbi:hypothetical protein NDU88_003489 [Pleurodeles waltl]|uniref:Uncharacterized protein n=1 Tax=Pleurodeles waltl TaxID=8319 RepID=A0AAV7L650_PLEWA|nr:hypothetical protein NDU88_003489 [Pleurodeles waltl]